MSLSLDAFREASKPTRSKCGVALVLDGLVDTDRAALVDALAEPSVTHAAIESVLKAAGHEINQGTVGRHRKGRCTCERTS